MLRAVSVWSFTLERLNFFPSVLVLPFSIYKLKILYYVYARRLMFVTLLLYSEGIRTRVEYHCRLPVTTVCRCLITIYVWPSLWRIVCVASTRQATESRQWNCDFVGNRKSNMFERVSVLMDFLQRLSHWTEDQSKNFVFVTSQDDVAFIRTTQVDFELFHTTKYTDRCQIGDVQTVWPFRWST